MLNRFVGGSAIVRVRCRRMEHGRTDGSSVLYTLKVTYCVRSTRCWLVEIMRVSAQEHYWRAVEKDDTAVNPCLCWLESYMFQMHCLLVYVHFCLPCLFVRVVPLSSCSLVPHSRSSLSCLMLFYLPQRSAQSLYLVRIN